MSSHNILQQLHEGPFEVEDPGDGKTITVDRFFMTVRLVSGATAQTRTLAPPTRAGQFVSLVLHTAGASYITITVTNNYSKGNADVVLLYAAQDFVTFFSIPVGSGYEWRLLRGEGGDMYQELGRGYDFVFDGTSGTKFGTNAAAKISFWAGAPVVQPSGAAQTALTDNSGGTADYTVEACPADSLANLAAAANNNFKEVVTLLNALRAALAPTTGTALIKGSA